MHTPPVGQPNIAALLPAATPPSPAPSKAVDGDGDHDGSPPSVAGKSPGVGDLLDTNA
jgi:hypothetical protein